MSQESAEGGIDPMWLNVELGVLIFFVLEGMMMIFGLGFKSYLTYGENRLDFVILLCTIVGYIATHEQASGRRHRPRYRRDRMLRTPLH